MLSGGSFFGKKRLSLSESYGTITTPWDGSWFLPWVKETSLTYVFDRYGIFTQWTGEILVDCRRWQTLGKVPKLAIIWERSWDYTRG